MRKTGRTSSIGDRNSSAQNCGRPNRGRLDFHNMATAAVRFQDQFPAPSFLPPAFPYRTLLIRWIQPEVLFSTERSRVFMAGLLNNRIP